MVLSQKMGFKGQTGLQITETITVYEVYLYNDKVVYHNDEVYEEEEGKHVIENLDVDNGNVYEQITKK